MSRGQVYTLEGVIGAIIIVSALILGLQAVDIAPWANDPVEQESERLRLQVEDVLAVADDRGDLRAAVTCVDDATPDSRVASNAEVTTLGELLNRTVRQDGSNTVVYVDYLDSGGESELQQFVHPQTEPRPTDGSVTATHYITLYDSDPIHEVESGECVPQDETIGDASPSEFYIPELTDQSDSAVYNVVRVRVIAW